MSYRLVISIDGGGIRGIIPLILLKEIQDRFSRNLFDLDVSWWGTSTGALISGAICIQRAGQFDDAVQHILDIYEFRSSAAIHPHGVSIPTRALDQLIASNFDGMQLSDFPELNIIVSKESDLTPVILNAHNSCELDKAVKASCAFPELFPPVEILGTSYVDGFFKAKNPTYHAYQHLKGEEKKLVVLSLGTGILREEDGIELQVKEVHKTMKGLDAEKEIHYFRFNPWLKNAVDSMQNTSPKNILNLRKDAQDYIDENGEELDRLLELLYEC